MALPTVCRLHTGEARIHVRYRGMLALPMSSRPLFLVGVSFLAGLWHCWCCAQPLFKLLYLLLCILQFLLRNPELLQIASTNVRQPAQLPGQCLVQMRGLLRVTLSCSHAIKLEIKSMFMCRWCTSAGGPAYLLQVQVDLREGLHFLLQRHGVGGVLGSSVVVFFVAVACIGVRGAL